MALKRAPIAHETTDAVGTGDYNLLGAIANRAPFNQDLNDLDDVFMMVRDDGDNWEINRSTYDATLNTLSRNVIQSAIGGVIGTTAVNWATGIKDIYSLPDIELLGTADFLQAANNLSDVQDAGTSRNNLGLGSAALEDVSKFITTDAGGTISGAAGNIGLRLFAADGTSIAFFDVGEAVAGPFIRLRWNGAANNAAFQVHDGVALGAVAVINQATWDFRNVDVLLAKDATTALGATTKQQMDAADAVAIKNNVNDQTISGSRLRILSGAGPNDLAVGEDVNNHAGIRWRSTPDDGVLFHVLAGTDRDIATFNESSFIFSAGIAVDVQDELNANANAASRVILPVGADKWAT